MEDIFGFGYNSITFIITYLIFSAKKSDRKKDEGESRSLVFTDKQYHSTTSRKFFVFSFILFNHCSIIVVRL